MGSDKLMISFVLLVSLPMLANAGGIPEFKHNKVVLSNGPFVNVLNLTAEQKKYSKAWKIKLQNELGGKVNFAGHYRLYLSKGGQLSSDCGVNGWVCGWVIDKETGQVVSELPFFNGNSKYYSTIDNGTPSPDFFSVEFYPNSNLIWVNGENVPKSKTENIAFVDKKCSNNAYIFKGGEFSIIFTGEC